MSGIITTWVYFLDLELLTSFVIDVKKFLKNSIKAATFFSLVLNCAEKVFTLKRTLWLSQLYLEKEEAPPKKRDFKALKYVQSKKERMCENY